MSLVSMTWPEYLAGCCRIDGHLTRLTLWETDLLLGLLLSHPNTIVPWADLTERVWSEFNQPTSARQQIKEAVLHLRRRGICITTDNRKDWGGYRIPREARGRPERIKLAA